MKLFATDASGKRLELPLDGGEIALPEQAALELTWEEERDWNIRLNRAGHMYPIIKVHGTAKTLGNAGSFEGRLVISSFDADGGNFESGSCQIRVIKAAPGVITGPVLKEPPLNKPVKPKKAPPKETPPAPAPQVSVAVQKGLEEQKRKLEAEIARLQAQRSACVQELKQLQDERDEAKAELDRLREDRKRLTDLGGGVRSLEGELKAAEMELADLRAQLEARKQEVDDLRETFTRLDKERLSYADSCRSAQAALEVLRAKHMDAEQALEELQAQRREAGMLDDEIAEMQERCAALRQARQAGQQALERLRRQAEKTGEQHRLTARQTHRLQAETRQLEKRDAELEAQQKALEQVTGKRLKAIRKKMAEIYEQVQICESLDQENRENVQLVLQVLNAAERDSIPEVLKALEDRRGELEALERQSEEIRAEVFHLVYERIEKV